MAAVVVGAPVVGSRVGRRWLGSGRSRQRQFHVLSVVSTGGITLLRTLFTRILEGGGHGVGGAGVIG